MKIRRHEFNYFGTSHSSCIHCGIVARALIGQPGRPHETISAYVVVFNKKGEPVIPSRVRCVERDRP